MNPPTAPATTPTPRSNRTGSRSSGFMMLDRVNSTTRVPTSRFSDAASRAVSTCAPATVPMSIASTSGQKRRIADTKWGVTMLCQTFATMIGTGSSTTASASGRNSESRERETSGIPMPTRPLTAPPANSARALSTMTVSVMSTAYSPPRGFDGSRGNLDARFLASLRPASCPCGAASAGRHLRVPPAVARFSRSSTAACH